MGSALLSGLVAAGWAPLGDLAVSETDPAQRARLVEAHPGLTVVDGPIEAADVLLAVKPDVAEAVLRTLGATGTAPGAVDRGRHLVGPAGGGAALRLGGGPGHAQHPVPGRRRRGRAVGRGRGHRGRPRLGRGDPVGRGHRGAGARAPARRRDRHLGLGPGLRLPRGRGHDRGRGDRRADPRREPHAGGRDPARRLADAGRDGPGPRRAAGRRHLARRYHGRRRPDARVQGGALRVHRGGGGRRRALAPARRW